MKPKKLKRCPRCNNKCDFMAERCSQCGLIFSRLDKATNRAGKKALKNGEPNKVVYTNKLPSDVNKWKLFLWALFLGWTGVHYAKIGKKRTCIFMVCSVVLLYAMTFLFSFKVLDLGLFSHKYWGIVLTLLLMPPCLSLMLWVVSVFEILFGRFKVPVSIDEEYVTDELKNSELAKDIINEVRGEEKTAEKPSKFVKCVCKSCGCFVKIKAGETVCPKCEEDING